MARILNLIIVIFEIIAISKRIKGASLRKCLIFYTQLSNLLTLFASAILVFLGPLDWVVVLRYLSVCMLVMTFFVTAFILVPMSHKAKELLFSGTGLYHHLIVPILSTAGYVLFEKRAPFFYVWLPPVVTLIYGFIMLYLNYIDRVEGPYPFFMIKRQGVKKTILWMVALFAVVFLFSCGVTLSPKI